MSSPDINTCMIIELADQFHEFELRTCGNWNIPHHPIPDYSRDRGSGRRFNEDTHIVNKLDSGTDLGTASGSTNYTFIYLVNTSSQS